MAFIGKTPTPVALTASDITDGIISNSKLAQDIISAETELTSAPADTDEFLISDAGVLKRLDASLVGVSGWSSNSGNLLPADASKGIYLGVNSATASNLLNDYEEGTFTPTWTGTSSVSVASGNYGYYTKIGNVVTVHFGAVLSSSSNSYYAITNAPFQSNIASGNAMGSAREYGHTGYSYVTIMTDNSTTISMVSYQNNAVANAYLACTLTYRTD